MSPGPASLGGLTAGTQEEGLCHALPADLATSGLPPLRGNPVKCGACSRENVRRLQRVLSVRGAAEHDEPLPQAAFYENISGFSQLSFPDEISFFLFLWTLVAKLSGQL